MLLGILLVLQILVSAALTAVILLQRSEGGALGMGGGPSGFMTARGAGDLLTRTTAILATVFFVLSLVLTMVSGKLRGDSSVVDRVKIDALSPDALKLPPAQNQTAPAPGGGLGAPVPQVQTQPAPTAPATPVDSGLRSPASQVLGVQTAPQAPQPAPAAPQPAAPAR
jgi:preprotein translocase subunit SecG